jgi:hypothetical protein
MGGEVPRSYYLNGKSSTSDKKPLSICSGSKEKLEFEITKAGSVLKYTLYMILL